MYIRFKLILPAMTDDYEDQYITFAKKTFRYYSN